MLPVTPKALDVGGGATANQKPGPEVEPKVGAADPNPKAGAATADPKLEGAPNPKVGAVVVCMLLPSVANGGAADPGATVAGAPETPNPKEGAAAAIVLEAKLKADEAPKLKPELLAVFGAAGNKGADELGIGTSTVPPRLGCADFSSALAGGGPNRNS